ncbi:MAG: SDR family NAD(P)-dependent oxidoreductase [Opitutales bacterium]
MDIAIVTGAETPLGLRLVQSLIQQGCRVHGIGNNFSKVRYADPLFLGHAVDLTDTAAVAALLEQILKEEQRLDILVHAIDVTPGTAFEKLPPGNLEAVLKIGFLGPVMLTRLALPNLLRFRGQLINVLTSNKNGHPSSAVNALIEGGLREMNRALFDVSRDAGLRITNCILRQNPRLPGAQVDDAVLEQTHIDLEDVARTIEQLLDPKATNVPSEVVLHPRLSADAEAALAEPPLPIDAYAAVTLPPKAYCPPEEPKIPTAEKQRVDRTIPYTDEEMEDKIAAAIEDFEAHPERYERADTGTRKQSDSSAQQDGRPPKSKRRRRRSGRNRNKQKEGGGAPGEPDSHQSQGEKPQGAAEQVQEKGESPKRDREEPGHHPAEPGSTPAEPEKSKPEAAPASPEKTEPGVRSADTEAPARQTSPKKKAAKKRPAKKATKQAAKKATKKAAKKSAKKKTAAKKAAPPKNKN